MKAIEVKNLVKRIAKGKGILSTIAKQSLEDKSYTKEFGISLLETAYSQINDDLTTASKMFKQKLIKELKGLKWNSTTHTKYYLIK